ncbi:hypothetical protein VB735_32860 [Halotia wernerae UHCC 0503]|nr:hypothetical protein [Halotia wernerae UHCC 0503]
MAEITIYNKLTKIVPGDRCDTKNFKKHEISGQMFDDELYLAYAVIDGIEARGEPNNYGTECFKFNNHPSS